FSADQCSAVGVERRDRPTRVEAGGALLRGVFPRLLQLAAVVLVPHGYVDAAIFEDFLVERYERAGPRRVRWVPGEHPYRAWRPWQASAPGFCISRRSSSFRTAT